MISASVTATVSQTPASFRCRIDDLQMPSPCKGEIQNNALPSYRESVRLKWSRVDCRLIRLLRVTREMKIEMWGPSGELIQRVEQPHHSR